jgi:LysR family hydrogen peroxide-inducible transcriptional activator
MLPTLRQLQYLKLLAEHGSFSRAAEAAHVSQPALSSGVQELEKILGGPVVERTRGQVQLTPIGQEAVRRAEDVLARAEDLVEAARNAGRPLSGRFRLGVQHQRGEQCGEQGKQMFHGVLLVVLVT